MSSRFNRALSALYENIWIRAVASPSAEDVICQQPRLKIFWPSQLWWPGAQKWASQIRIALSHHGQVIDADTGTETGILTHFQFGDGRSTDVFFDISDYPNSFNEKWLTAGVPYFKLQLLARDSNPESVVPGGYIVNDPIIYKVLPHLRRLRRQPGKFDVYGRFGRGFAPEFRTRCIGILEQAGRPMQGGFEFARYSRFLREAAQAKVCIDLPGNGPLCFRFVDYMAMGCCVIASPHGVKLPAPLLHGVHLMYMKPDMSDLPELVEVLLGDPLLRETMSNAAARYFDEHLSLRRLGGYYVSEVQRLLSGKLAGKRRPLDTDTSSALAG